MSQIKLEAPFQEYRGKICRHSQVIYKQVFDTKYTSQICNPHEGEPTEAQKAHREKFKKARAKVLSLTEEEKAAYKLLSRSKASTTPCKGSYSQKNLPSWQ